MQLIASAWPKRRHLFARHRRAAVAVLFATMVIPILGLIGLSIDYGIWNEADSSLSLAASSAALNAAKTAASALALADSNYVAEGVTSGKQWFLAELGQGSYQADSGTVAPTVTITTASNMVTATVTYTSTVNSIFGKLFHMARYNITVTTAATMSAGSYLEVILMLDNSSSMGIGATTADMTTLMQSSPCDLSNENYKPTSSSAYTQATWEPYSLYQYNYTVGGQTYQYDGTMTTPVVSGSLTFKPTTGTTVVNYCSAAGGSCVQAEQCPNVNGSAAYAGPPCAFACHSDNSTTAGLGNDLWAMARRKGVTLRLDTVKKATNTVLTAMQNNNVSSLNNLSVGVYTFNSALNPIYPGTGCTPQAFGCEAGSNWSTAISAVGLPPASGSYTDTGIQPPLAAGSGDNDNTAVEEAMANLANNYVTAAGNGATAATPRKVLMLITDGFEDDPIASAGINGLRQAMPASACTPFKNMGYTVYVIYTPYYPLMHTWYLQYGIPIVEGSGPNSIPYNLQACASNANDYIAASDTTDLSNALLGFLSDALNSPATFTQ